MNRTWIAVGALLAAGVLLAVGITASGAYLATRLLDKADPPRVVQVSAGYGNSCALRTDGGILCWGDNSFGELGDGTTTDHRTPVVVQGIHDAIQVGVGHNHVCARSARTGWSCAGGTSAPVSSPAEPTRATAPRRPCRG